MNKSIVVVLALLVLAPGWATATQTPAANISVATSSFSNCLTSSDTNVQLSLNDIDVCLGSLSALTFIDSLVKISGNVSLVNDSATPGDSKYYGTNSGGTFGYFSLPAGSVTSIATSAPITGGTITSSGTIGITQSTTSTNGYLSSTDWNTFNGKQASGSYITALTGDGTASGPGSAAFTLATVNTNTGAFGSSTAIPNFTVNGKGLITAAGTNAVIAPAGTLTGTTLASNVVTSSLTTVGTIGTGVWQGTPVAYQYGGTGLNTAPADDLAVGNGTGWTLTAIGSCSAGSSALTYNTSTHAFGCNTITGGVTSVSNSDSTITASPTTGAVVVSLNLAHSNTWTINQNVMTNVGIGTNTPQGAGLVVTSGNVGVGTWVPGALMDVQGTTGHFYVQQNGNVGVGILPSSAALEAFSTSPISILGISNSVSGVGVQAQNNASGTTLATSGNSTNSSTNYINVVINGTQSVANSGAYLALVNQPTYNATSGNTLADMEGVRNNPSNGSSGTITQLAGLYNEPANSSSGTVGSLWAEENQPLNLSTGTVNNMYGLYVQGKNANASGTVTNYYGAYFDTPIKTGVITHEYGVWQNDTAGSNYFGANVGIGSTVPGQKLDVQGTIRTIGLVSTALTASSPVISNSVQQLASGTYSGNTTTFGTTSGTLTNGDCVKIDSSGNLIDAGSPCAGSASTPGGGLNAVEYNSPVGTFSGKENVFSFNGTNVGIGTTNGINLLDVHVSPSKNALEVNSVGNVAIGTKTAGNTLVVGSTGQLSVDSSGDLTTSGQVQTIEKVINNSGNTVVAEEAIVGSNDEFLNSTGVTGFYFTGANVGINQSSPGAQLDVQGTTKTSNLTLSSVASGTQCLHANSSGVVSGTGSDCGAGGGTPGGLTSEVQYNSAGSFAGFATFTTNGTNVGVGTAAYSNRLTVLGNLGIGAANGDAYTTTAGPTGGAIIAGNVGIGSTTPGQSLDVQGTVRDIGEVLTSNSSPASITNLLYNNAGSLYFNGSLVGGGGIPTQWVTIANVGIGTFGANNNVGVGTVSPTATLYVGNVPTNSTMFRVDNNVSSTTSTLNSITTTPGSANCTPGNISGNTRSCAQVFNLASTSTIVGASWYFNATFNSPTGTITCDIVTTTGGTPTTNIANPNLTVAFTPTQNSLNSFNFTGAATLSSGTYALYCASTGAQSSNNSWRLDISGAPGTYDSWLNQNGSWSDNSATAYYSVTGYLGSVGLTPIPFVITSFGNTGIGSSSPGQQLDVNGTVRSSSFSVGSNAGVTGSGSTSCLCKAFTGGICTTLGTCT